MPSIGKNQFVTYSVPRGQIRSERSDSSSNAGHMISLSPANLSDEAINALKAAVESSDKSQASLALLASHVIGDGQLTLHSGQQEEAVYKKLMDRTAQGPQELTVRVRMNDFQMYDILEITQSRDKAAPTAISLKGPSERGAETPRHPEASTSRLRNWTSAATQKAQQTLGLTSPGRSLPRLTKEAKRMIAEADIAHALTKTDQLDVRHRYQQQMEQNQRLQPIQRVSDQELWSQAIDDAERIPVSRLSAREKLQLQKEGMTLHKAKIFALFNSFLYPIGRYRDRHMSDETRARLNAETQKIRQMPIGNGYPSSLGPLSFARSTSDLDTESDDQLPELRKSIEDPSSLEVDSQAYHSLGLEEREALDALADLIDAHGLDSAMHKMSPKIRDSFDGYQLRRNRLSQHQTPQVEQGEAM
ncbi:hypothetical protein [Pseudomonas sp. D1-1]|uniref:hypothetical protein n=1 Tax=Pseudomonas sp. D1-1 TaxID=1040793 RepID=UPI003DAA147E